MTREKLMKNLGTAKEKVEAGQADIDAQRAAIIEKERRGRDQTAERARLGASEIEQDEAVSAVDGILDKLDSKAT